MNLRLLLLIFIFQIPFSVSLNAQDLIQKENSIYNYQGKKYRSTALKDIMKLSPNAYPIYIEGRKKMQYTAYLAIGGILSVPGGAFLSVFINEGYGGFALLGGALFGVFAITNHTSAKKLIHKSIQTFNDDINNEKPVEPETSSIEIGVFESGVGLVLKF